MKNLLIIGARGWGREIFNMLPDCIGYQSEFDVKGFLDDDPNALDGKPGYPPILNSVEDYTIEPNDVFVCAMGDAQWKKHYAELVLNKGGKFITLVHKNADIQRNTSLGEGCIVCPNATISCDIKVGCFVTFMAYSTVGHDSVVDDYAHIGTRSFMGGYSSLGCCSTLHTGSIVLPHVKVGDNCIVGAGSVVIRKVSNGTTVYGNPATKLKY